MIACKGAAARFLPEALSASGSLRARLFRTIGSVVAIALATLLAAHADAQPTPTPGQKEWRTNLLVRTAMRDGTELVSHVFLPTTPGPHPVLLERTSYGISGPYLLGDGPYWASKGYAYVVQDVRGRGDSEGQFAYYRNEAADGYDTIEWLARQPWSNGRVGMIGASYGGVASWYAAAVRPPSLFCINVDMVVAQPFEEVPYQGGAFRLDWALTWPLAVSGRQWHTNAVLAVNWADVWGKRPLATLDEEAGQAVALYREVLAHPTFDDYWEGIRLDGDTLAGLDLPTLAFTGWVDGALEGTTFLYSAMRERSAAPDRQHIVIGPWPHATAWDGGGQRTTVGEIDFGPGSLMDARAIKTRFFEHCLAQRAASFEQPGALLFLSGINRWISAPAYPVAGTQEKSFYLDTDQQLSPDPPASPSTEEYRYDPDDPMPAYVGQTQRSDALVPGEIHMVDHAGLARRSDVLAYETAALSAPVTALGDAYIELWAASDGPDTDFVAKLLDIHPDGRALMIGSKAVGVIRAQYREGYENPMPLVPGEPVRLRINLMGVGHQFKAGHRIGIQVSSSAYPWIDANPNTGAPFATATETRIAHQTVHHGAWLASRLVLSTIDEDLVDILAFDPAAQNP